jgi:hypothetical protein
MFTPGRPVWEAISEGKVNVDSDLDTVLLEKEKG